MKKFLSLIVLSCAALSLVAPTAEARRLGGGSNIGKQRSSPAMREAPREAPRATPAPAAAPAAAATAAAPAATAARPGFMSRWGGVIAGVGMGALLGSMLGGSLGGLGSALGGMLNILLIAGVLYLAYRFFASRRRPAQQASMQAGPMQFAGAGGPSFGGGFRAEPMMAAPRASSAAPVQAAIAPGIDVPPGFEIEPFVRQAQTSFLRLQAANDDRDLADLRETTTPEVFAELSMQMRERGDAPQKTEILSLDARLLEVVVEGQQLVASLRYSGLVREAPGTSPVPFDEVWHLRRAMAAANDPWLIAGIQQMA